MMIISSLFSPITLAFLVIAVGYCIGQIKLFSISLGQAGVLITAVAVGYLISYGGVINSEATAEIESNMKVFSSLGTAMFVSVIGITTGYSLNFKDRANCMAVLVGALMVISAFITMRVIVLLDGDISFSVLIGTLCGALTTTPGLSAALELESVISEEAALGYGSAYLFGVIFTVLIVQLIIGKSSGMAKNESNLEMPLPNKAAFQGILQICVAIVFGRVLGNLFIPGLNFSLGSSGGVLCMGIVIGIVVKKLLPDRCALEKSIGLLRNFGLVLFFVGNGIPAGIKLNNGLEIKTILYGILMTLVTITVGWLLCKVMTGKVVNSSASVIAGGMTSTPAICVLVQKVKGAPLGQYSLAYVGALITVIILIRCL